MDVWPAIVAERRTFVAYLRTLPDDAWTRPSLVAGWTVRQVVAHMIALSEITLGAFLVGMAANGVSLNRLNDAGVRRIAETCSNAQLIDRLEARVTARTHPPGCTNGITGPSCS